MTVINSNSRTATAACAQRADGSQSKPSAPNGGQINLAHLPRDIAFWNCRSLSSKVAHVGVYLRQRRPAVLALAEVWPTAVARSKQSFKFPHYSFVDVTSDLAQAPASSPENGNTYGGLGYFIRDDITWAPLPSVCLTTNTTTQLHAISIQAPFRLDLVTCYIHPSAPAEQRQRVIAKLDLLSALSSTTPTVIMGDFNRHASIIQRLEDLHYNMNTMFAHGAPTHRKIIGATDSTPAVVRESTLDLCYASDPASIDRLAILDPGGKSAALLESDHFPLQLRISSARRSTPAEGPTTQARIWNIPKPSKDDFHTVRLPAYHEALNLRLRFWFERHSPQAFDAANLECPAPLQPLQPYYRLTQQQLDTMFDELLEVLTTAGQFASGPNLASPASPDIGTTIRRWTNTAPASAALAGPFAAARQ